MEGNGKSQKKQRCRPLTSLVVVLHVEEHIGDVSIVVIDVDDDDAMKLKMVKSLTRRPHGVPKQTITSVTCDCEYGKGQTQFNYTYERCLCTVAARRS